MLDTIFIGTTGLLNHSKGLRTVGNNLANVNTPGFKSSQLQFSNLFEQNGGYPSQSETSGKTSQAGGGLTTLGAQINFRAGLEQGTGNPLDLAISGNGFFTVKRGDELLYTRAGDFGFNDKGILVNAMGDHVQALDSGGKLSDITLAHLEHSLPKATSTVLFQGNLTSVVANPPVDASVASVTVLDASGVNYPLSLSLHNDGGGAFTVTAKDKGGKVVGSGAIKFSNGAAVAGEDAISFSYEPAGATAIPVKLDFSAVKSLSTATTLTMQSQDGYSVGVKTDQTIDAEGTLKVQYSNGQTASGQRLALADFQAESALQEAGGSAFRKVGTSSVLYGYAGVDTFGDLAAGRREGSNVDLAEEFGNLILMQRGYQASSHVISTANDMIQQLFDMKGNR